MISTTEISLLATVGLLVIATNTGGSSGGGGGDDVERGGGLGGNRRRRTWVTLLVILDEEMMVRACRVWFSLVKEDGKGRFGGVCVVVVVVVVVVLPEVFDGWVGLEEEEDGFVEEIVEGRVDVDAGMVFCVYVRLPNCLLFSSFWLLVGNLLCFGDGFLI